MITFRTTWDKRGSLGVHLCQKDPKLVKKWLNYSYFSTERLSDFIENHMGLRGTPGCLFVPKRSKIGQEMAELWPRGCVIPLRTTWAKKGILGCSFVPKRSKIGQEMAELWPRGCVIPLKTTLDKKGILGCSFVPKRSKIGQEMAELWLFYHLQVAGFH